MLLLTTVFIAAPGMGHVLPLLQLAFWAATSGVMSTFIASDVPLEKLASSGQLANLEHPNLRLVGLKSGGVTWADFSQGPKAIMSLYQQMIVPTEATLRALVAGAEVKDGMSGKAVEAVPAPTAIVASPFIFFGPPIAKELGLRWTTLVDTSVIGAVVTLKLADEAASCSDDEAVCPGGVNMPGYMDVPASDLINVFGEAKLTKKSPTVWLASGFRDLVKASDSLLVNTTSGLDPELLKYFTPRATYPIGPIFQRTPVVLENGPVKAFLGAQQPRSLLYIALGSLGSLSHAQSEALISVLRTTKLPFLWVDRDPLVCDLGGDGGQGPRSKVWLPLGRRKQLSCSILRWGYSTRMEDGTLRLRPCREASQCWCSPHMPSRSSTRGLLSRSTRWAASSIRVPNSPPPKRSRPSRMEGGEARSRQQSSYGRGLLLRPLRTAGATWPGRIGSRRRLRSERSADSRASMYMRTRLSQLPRAVPRIGRPQYDAITRSSLTGGAFGQLNLSGNAPSYCTRLSGQS